MLGLVWVYVPEDLGRRYGGVDAGLRRSLRAGMFGRLRGGPRHEEDEERADMFPFALGVVFCYRVQDGVGGSEELADVVCEEFQFLSHDS